MNYLNDAGDLGTSLVRVFWWREFFGGWAGRYRLINSCLDRPLIALDAAAVMDDMGNLVQVAA